MPRSVGKGIPERRIGKGVRIIDKKEHIGFELRLIQHLLEANMVECGDEDGVRISQIQHWIIQYLYKNQDRDVFQRDLESEFRTSRATISSTLKVMERNGLVVRESVEWDARLKKITLTDRAKACEIRGRQNVDNLERLLRKGMSKEESEELMRLLRLIRHNLEQARAAGWRWEECLAEDDSAKEGDKENCSAEICNA